MSRTTILIVAVVAAAALGAGIATATIPDSSGTIHGCYKTSGNLTLIDTGKGAACQVSESAVAWSQKGVQGLPGPQGVQGQQGPTGSTGPDGVSDYSIATGQATTSSGHASAEATCPTGSTAVGGGFDVPASANVTPYESSNEAGAGWLVTFYGDDGVTFTVYAVCVGKQQLMGS